VAKLVPVNLSERAYIQIKKMISDYRFSPGSRLNVEQLARDLGTSRTPIWEAVRRLEQEGLAKNIPNRGVFLVELTHEAAIELYTVVKSSRGWPPVSPWTGSPTRRSRRWRRCSGAEKIVAEEDLVAYSKSDFDFHACIYSACGNTILREMLENIKEKARPFEMRITPILTELFNDHQMIVRAMRLRDPLLAEVAFREHNQRVLRQLHAEDLDGRIRHTNIPPKGRKP